MFKRLLIACIIVLALSGYLDDWLLKIPAVAATVWQHIENIYKSIIALSGST